MAIRRGIAGAFLLLALVGPASAQEVSGRLSARPQATAPAGPAGLTALGNGAFAYRPHTAAPRPLPLLVLLHGAGGNARDFIQLFRSTADARGYGLLALQSGGRNWDMAADIVRRSARAPGGKAVPRFGADVHRIDAALREYFATTSVDPRRIVLVGFSDGAAYALSLGLANPDLFPGVVAFAPGFIKLPDRLQPGQRIFIAHGRKDSVIPFETGRRIAEVLSTSELAVRFRAFDSGHAISRGALDSAVPFALGETAAATDALPRR